MWNFRQYGQLEKQRWGESERSRKEVRRSEKRTREKAEEAVARKGTKVAIHCVFHWFVTPEGQKVGSLKRRVQSHLAKWEKVARRCGAKHISKKVQKAHQHRTTFRSSDVKKVRAVVARSTFASQKCKKLKVSDHFWTFRCRFVWQAQGIAHLVKSEH